MIVGTCRLVLSIPHADSLKDKRSVVRRAVDRARARFNVAIAEVADQDVHRRAVIGLAVVSNDRRHANSMIDEIVSMIESSVDALLVERSMRLERVDLADPEGYAPRFVRDGEPSSRDARGGQGDDE